MLGGGEKVKEAGGVLAGGHSIADTDVKYGLSVMGTIHPDKAVSYTHLLFVFLLVTAVIAYFSIIFIMSTLSFWFIKSNMFITLIENLERLIEYPVSYTHLYRRFQRGTDTGNRTER